MKFDINTLSGKHKLTGVGNAATEEGYILEIDGKRYIVYEQDDDEYRSNCAIQEITEGDYYYSKETVVEFPEQEVEIVIGDTYDSEYTYGVEFEEFRILNSNDKSTIFLGYTGDWHDYYPYAQFEYHPENLPINK
jgi:hypothetical protein